MRVIMCHLEQIGITVCGMYSTLRKTLQSSAFPRTPLHFWRQCLFKNAFSTWYTAQICVDGIGPCKKVQHFQIGVSTEACRRFCCRDYRQTSRVTSALQELGWEDLQSRRDQNKATMMYRNFNNFVEIPEGQYLNATGVATREHHQQFLPVYCSINAYKGSFFPSKVRLWNGLPANVISAPTLEDFKLLVGGGILRSSLWTTFYLILNVHMNLPAHMF